MYLMALILVGGFLIAFLICSPIIDDLFGCVLGVISSMLAIVLLFFCIWSLVTYCVKEEDPLSNAVVEMYLENNEISDIADSADITVLEVIRILRENGFEVKR